jgi:dTDP-4-dehydrorhamnose reductase
LPIFLSTDYVFPGTSTEGYADDAPRGPTTEYGRQKAEVEEALERSGRPYLILRLSKVYGLERGDKSFLDEIAARLYASQTYAAARDQIFCPTCVHDLGPGFMELQSQGFTGTMNFCAPEPWARYDIARAVAKHLRLPMELVQPVTLADLPGNFPRPQCTRLLPNRLTRETSIHFTPLEKALPQLARSYGLHAAPD